METQPPNSQPDFPEPTPRACPRCHSRVRRHEDAASHQIGLYSCRCGFIFKSPNSAQQTESTTVNGNPESDDSCTNFSEISYEKTRSSYDQSEIAVKKQTFRAAHQWRSAIREAAPTCPHPPSLNLGHRCLTKHPQIVSETGPRETNETGNSYETLRHSYKRCLTQHLNRIWECHFAETTMRRLVSTTPPNPVLHGYTLHSDPFPSRERELPPSCWSVAKGGHYRDQWRCYTVHISMRG